jgi:hypothetical protein
MAKTKKLKRAAGPVLYDTMPYKVEGVGYTLFVCRRCPRAWKLKNPVDAWRVKALVNHFTSHDLNKAIGDMVREAADDANFKARQEPLPL